MSLLEDVFLEDEAGEAQELERVIEGDEYDERPQSPNSDDDEEKEDEAEEDKRRVDPNQSKTKRVVKNPRFILNPARLTGPRGIQVIPDHFKDFKFKGKGHEKDDLDLVLKKLEHWAYRLYPKFEFSDCLKKIETLGKKRPVMVHLHKIRSDQFTSEETVVQRDSSDDEATPAPEEEDEFDKLLQQQIELARATPAPGSIKKAAFNTPSVDRSLMMPKATSSPSISEEQRERMLRNRRLAEERRLAKLKNERNSTDQVTESPKQDVINEENELNYVRKHNRSNVIDSSDDEGETVVNQSIAVDVHEKTDKNNEDNAQEIEKVDSDNESNKDSVIDNAMSADKTNEKDEINSDTTQPVINSEVFLNTDHNLTNHNEDKLNSDHSNTVMEQNCDTETIESEVNAKIDENNINNDIQEETNNGKANSGPIEEVADSINEKSEDTNKHIKTVIPKDTDTGEDNGELKDDISKLNENNKEKNDENEEIMDIDFSDDF